ncbi:hypothetical protein FT663_05391 [Candidozyma haemuli var. vulneris]|nr:hypothetical protein FT662_05405 [[Candida] haemuloni var. vulneris]KAF3985199.1 hypothetical protein FT663_05391 [[Candida] haemuloni var. vulneris]
MNASTSLPPCCLRIHPENPEIVVFGTYKLEKPSSLRHGSLDVYSTTNNNFNLLSSTKTESAVLDLKVCPDDSATWVSAHSTGNICIWTYTNHKLELRENLELFDKDVLVTSVFFSPTDKTSLLATLTSGEAALVDLTSGAFRVLAESHSLECWTGAFGEEGPAANVVFTGGDDARLISHDLRTDSKIWATSHRHHDAGVVSILCPGKEWPLESPNCLWTGSYDDNLRVFDLRKLDTDEGPSLFPSLLPQELHKINLEGGVWRLIPAPKTATTPANSVLACCMYQGAYIVSAEAEKPAIHKFFKGNHDSMVYGGDWASSGDTVITCSFYDNVIEQWSPNA